MAIVIHTIGKNQYAYEHYRVGNTVKSDYVGRISGEGQEYQNTQQYKPALKESEITQQYKPALKESEITQHLEPPTARTYGTSKAYYAVSAEKDLFGKPAYRIESISFSPSGKYLNTNSYTVHTKKEIDIIIESNPGMIKTSKSKLDQSFNTHKEPSKDKRIMSMKQYLKTLDKNKE